MIKLTVVRTGLTYPNRFVSPTVTVRVFKAPKDWQPVLEQVVSLEANSDLRFGRVTRPEASVGECWVSFSESIRCRAAAEFAVR